MKYLSKLYLANYGFESNWHRGFKNKKKNAIFEKVSC